AGSVQFFVAARGLPAGVPLGSADITVTAGDGTRLPATVRPVATTSARSPVRAVVLVIDTSGSMAGARLLGARAAAADYAAAAPPDMLLGLVTISDQARVVLAPTRDRASFRAAAGQLAAKGRTALYDGIQAGQQLLDPKTTPAAAAYVERRVVVLSDGADTASALPVDRLARNLSRATATVDAVAFGTGADRAELTELTAMTGGRVLDAADAAALRSIFRSLAAQLSAPVLVDATVPAALAGRTTTISVKVTAGAVSASADTPVVFSVDPAAATARTTFTVPRTGNGGLIAAAASVAAAVLTMLVLVARPAGARRHIERRLQELDRFTARGAAPAPAAEASNLMRAALAVSERAVARPGRRERIEQALDAAAMNLRASEWQLLQLGLAVGAALVALLLLPWWCALPAGLCGGWFGAAFYLRIRATRRTRAFAEQLPDALQLVVGSLRAGFSLPQSIDALVREGDEPVAGELGRALAETRLGGNLEDALDRVGKRNASQDVDWLVMAIRIQKEVGGNLSEVLETAVGTMRERARLGRHVRALSAEGRLSALILLGMPIVIGGWMFAFRNEYIKPLYTQPLGIAMLTISVVMICVGGLWLRKIVQVEV
ncbi:MAG TPA: type II secretion system F family protein, partial [Actinoplanes sp.]|nr:type II secretion system F family protein [Actinoplanes sp.]